MVTLVIIRFGEFELFMRYLRTTVHPEILEVGRKCFQRLATRGIILREKQILLLYTEKYDDYSLPGGGVDEGEVINQGLIRELKEEVGAQGVHNIREFGMYREYRPWYKGDYEQVEMISYCFYCELSGDLRAPQLEPHEISNGMRPVWINIHLAIEHNESVIQGSDKKGLSIDRETYLLKRIVEECNL